MSHPTQLGLWEQPLQRCPLELPISIVIGSLGSSFDFFATALQDCAPVSVTDDVPSDLVVVAAGSDLAPR